MKYCQNKNIHVQHISTRKQSALMKDFLCFPIEGHLRRVGPLLPPCTNLQAGKEVAMLRSLRLTADVWTLKASKYLKMTQLYNVFCTIMDCRFYLVNDAVDSCQAWLQHQLQSQQTMCITFLQRLPWLVYKTWCISAFQQAEIWICRCHICG